MTNVLLLAVYLTTNSAAAVTGQTTNGLAILVTREDVTQHIVLGYKSRGQILSLGEFLKPFSSVTTTSTVPVVISNPAPNGPQPLPPPAAEPTKSTNEPPTTPPIPTP